MEGLPHEYRWSLYVLRLADRWKQLPSAIEQEPQDTMGHLERERIVLEALKRHS